MRTAIYVRVSTEEQMKEGFSIAAQRERLEAYAKSQGWEIIHYYVDEVSAKDMNRPELQRMLGDIREGLIDVVLVYRLDRLTRSVLDLYQLLETFEDNNCKFKSATEVYDTTTAMGRLFITLVAALAQWERENLGERVSIAMSQKARQGEWHGSHPPYGFDYIDGELRINEEEAKYIQWLYKWYIEGLSDRKIAMRLNDMGISTKQNNLWRERRVRYILTNPLYKGTMRWGVRVNREQGFEVEDAVPAIVDDETYEQAQRTRDGRRGLHPRRMTSPYIFSGSLRCARCGGAFKGHKNNRNGKSYLSYRCINRYIGECDMPMIAESILESAFLRFFQHVPEPTIEPKEKQQSDNVKEIERLERELIEIKRRRKKWQYAWANEMGMTDEEYKDRMKEEQVLEDEIREALSDISDEEEELPPEHTNIIGQYIGENWEELTQQEKKVFVQNTIEEILLERVDVKTRVDRAKILEIRFK